ncbi:sensor histidine kinase [Paenibacillus bouchesdurhonensis]|uniref:sensor histidine kinase n=1 Tax=Paenibacillus bouchesdurhonensis TaxID=1870990 RepID=UPI000DA61243|nr:sensor histidine kinase [Paenibacillus bouchesdurhonensis]
MPVTIELPRDLNVMNSLMFCRELELLEDADVYNVDCRSLGNVEPFGMLLIGSRLRQLIKDKKEKGAKFFARNYEHNDYAAHMGFFKSVQLNYGNAPGEAKGSSTYLPITKIDVQELITESHERREHVVDTIEGRTRQLSKVLSCGNKNIEGVLTYSIREIMRNVLEHSYAESIWYAGQVWPSKDRVEVCILDEGIGVQKALKANRHLEFKTAEEALLLAIEPGISGKDIKAEQRRDEVYGNSGYGLFMTSRICQDNGSFIIGSTNSFIIINGKGHKSYESPFTGTIIRLSLNISNIAQIDSLLPIYLKEGAKRARDNKHLDSISASKSSRLLLRKDK